MIDLKKIKENPDNPRLIKDDKFRKLCKSIKEFPKMMALRPMIVTEDWIVLGGNMRRKALEELGYEKIPKNWVKFAKDFNEEEQRRFLITDNVGYGEWDWEILRANWDVEALNNWDLKDVKLDEDKTNGEIQFSKELDFESNFIVLKFTNDIDWINAKTLFGLDSVHSKRANGKPWSKGIGRVIDGVDAIKKMQADES